MGQPMPRKKTKSGWAQWTRTAKVKQKVLLDPNSSDKSIRIRAELDQVYRQLGLHPGGEYQFWMACHSLDNMREMAKRMSVGLESLKTVEPAYSKDGLPLDGYIAVFTDA